MYQHGPRHFVLQSYRLMRCRRSGRLDKDALATTLLKMCREIATGMEYLANKSFVHRVSDMTTTEDTEASNDRDISVPVGFGCEEYSSK